MIIKQWVSLRRSFKVSTKLVLILKALLLGCIALASAAPSKVEDSETPLEGDGSKQRSVEDGSLTSEASESRFLVDHNITNIQRKSQ